MKCFINDHLIKIHKKYPEKEQRQKNSQKFMKKLDKRTLFDIIIFAASLQSIAELCKGSTTDSDSVCLGSNPSSAAISPVFPGLIFEVWLSLVERYVRDVEAGGSNPLTSTI